MLNPWIKIKIGKYVFTYCQSIQINKDYVGFTDKAVITMPNVVYQSAVNDLNGDLYNMIKRTDPVEIWFGDKELISEFKGFVNKVQLDHNIVISCENYSFALKQVNISSKIFRDSTLKQLIDYTLKGVNISVIYEIDEDTSLGDVAIENYNYINALQILEHLQQKYVINSFFDGTTLIIGQFTKKTGTQHNLLFENNIISNNLEYIDEALVRLVIKGVSMIPGEKKDTKIEKWIYKENGKFIESDEEVQGEIRTLTYYNLTEANLIERVKAEYDRIHYTGFKGSFQTFLKPSINPGDSVYFRSLKYDHKKGEYKVRSINKTLDINGVFQDVELDHKLR